MSPPANVPMPRLLALGAAVLAAHLWFLQAAPRTVQVARAKATPFVTRSIAAPPQAARLQPSPSVPAARGQAPGAAAARRLAAVNQSSRPAAAAVSAPQQEAATAPPAQAAAPARTMGPGPQAIAYAIPAPARLHYQVTASVRGQDRLTQGELVWRHDGENYEASLELSGGPRPVRAQRSTGRITADGLAPLRFSDKLRSEEAAHFQRDQGKVTFSSNRPDAPLLAGAQDRLSVLLQLAAMIAGDPVKFPPGTTIAIQTAGTRDAGPWLFLVEGGEELSLPGGVLTGIKLTRAPRHEYDQKVELWLAPTMDYVPVRLRLTQPNGDSVDQQWSSTDRG